MKPRLAVAGLGLAAAAALVAHEGHEALELKGVEFDGQRVVLAPRTETAIGLQTAVARAVRSEQTIAVNAVAALAPGARAFAGAPLPGAVITVDVVAGARVARGDLLAVVDSPELEGLALQWRQAKVDLEAALGELKRAESAGAVVPQQDREALVSAVGEREIAVEAARGMLEALGLEGRALELLAVPGADSRRMRVESPLDGVVVHVDVTPGESVHHDRHMFEVADDRETWVEGLVPEAFASGAVPGCAVRVTFDGDAGRTIPGTLDRVDVWLDEGARGLRVHARLEGERRARTGAPGRLEILLGSEEAVLVPAGAVVRRGLDRLVFAATADGAWAPTRVRIGMRRGGDLEVLEGLSPGDTVIVAGAHPLSSLFAAGALEVSAEERRTHDIRVAEVDLRLIDDVVRMPALFRVPPGRAVWASLPVGGRVTALLAVPGAAVAAGAPLAEVDAIELRDDQVALIRAEARLALLDRRAAGFRALESRGVSVVRDRVRIETEARQERLAAASLRARLSAAGFTEADLASLAQERRPRATVVVRAPIGGIVASVVVVPGQVVEPRARLVEIVDSSVLHAEGFLSALDAGRLPSPEGLEALARPVAFREFGWTGSVIRVAPGVEKSGVLAIWSEAPNPGGELRPGMTAELTVVVATDGERVITAPAEALWPSGGDWFVFLEEGGGFRRQRVVPGRRGSRHVEIRRGLYPGDLVAVSGLDELDVALGALR